MKEMEIKPTKVKIRDLVVGYKNNNEDGVWAYGGKLNIRPKYQREFIYKDKQRDAVIESIRDKFPLNSIYWVKNGENFEVLDGQQRTISICSYVASDYSINNRKFHNLTEDEKDLILDYELTVYECEGTDSEKLRWFNRINIAGEKLTNQELRNAIYSGPWLEEAKRHFSKTGNTAQKIGDKYLKGSSIRQEYLETALDWISNGCIEDYMSNHQKDSDCAELWLYFQNVINWVKTIFPTYYKEMKGIEWGFLYNKYKDTKYDIKKLQEDIEKLMMDDDVTKKSGIFEYLLSGKTIDKVLNIRAFTDSQKRTAFTKQAGICPKCNKTFTIEEMEGDHITPWSAGGKTDPSNLQMICKNCNRTKSSK